MGTCWSCGAEISLGKERTHCDECGNILFYKCNNCKEEFEVKDKKTNKKLKISEVREEGSYGQEYRDAFNLLVCLGKLKIVQESFQKKEKQIKYDVYIRIDGEPCKLLSRDDLIINECTNPKHQGNKRFSLNVTHCPTCPPNSKGKNKGQLRELTKRLNDKDVCQLYRGHFIKKRNG